MRRLPITLIPPKNLIKELQEKKDLLAKAYKEAAEDEEMNKEIKLWDQCIGDGLNESNKY